MFLVEKIRPFATEIVLAAVSLAVSASVHIFSSLRFPNDDQFITFRYIDNIASGHGFVYNVGEHVLGTTTPLFTLLGALVKLLLPAVSTPELMAWTNVLFLAAGCVLFYRVLTRLLDDRFAFFGALVFAFHFSKAVPEGMESPLFILFVLSFLLMLLEQRFRTSAIFLSLACLTRPDAGLIAVLAFAFWWRRAGLREALVATGMTVLVALPWLLFAMWYFGSIIPQSLVAKMHGHDIYILPAIQALKVQLAALSRIYWGAIIDPDNLLLQSIFNLGPFLVLAGTGAWQLVRKGLWVFPAIPLVYLVSYSLSNPVLFPWYSTQVEPLWILVSLCGAGWVMTHLPWRSARVVFCGLLLIGPLFFWTQLLLMDRTGTKGDLFAAGEYLAQHVKGGEGVALSNIGIVGYVSGARIIDTIGLTYPQASAFYPWSETCRDMTSLYQIPSDLIRALRPEWIVAGSAELTTCLRESGWFRDHYREAWRSRAGTVIWQKVVP